MKLIVNRGPRPKLTVKHGALDFILNTSLSSRRIETGGILIGHQKGGDIEVVTATDAGPNAVRSACTVLRDTNYCRSILQKEFEVSGADYVGEWHSHVIGLDHLSEGDIATLAGIMTDSDYDFESFAMILVNMNQENACVAKGYMAVRTSERTIEIMEVPIIATFSNFD